jgi:hypothetical protein
MSYNSAYRQDDKPNMSASTLSYTQNTVNQISATFFGGGPIGPVVNFNPDLSIDWSTKSFVDKNADFIDDLHIRSTASTVALPEDYQLLDNKVMRLH